MLKFYYDPILYKMLISLQICGVASAKVLPWAWRTWYPMTELPHFTVHIIISIEAVTELRPKL